MTIVTARPPRPRRPASAKPAHAMAAVIATTRKPGRRLPAPLAEDPEADARVRAFFARMIRAPDRLLSGKSGCR